MPFYFHWSLVNPKQKNQTLTNLFLPKSMFFLYSFIYVIATFFVFLPQYLKRPNELRGKWFREKLGDIVPDGAASFSDVIWIHAVSVGEVNASIEVIRRINKEYPRFSIFLSTITDTGQKVAREKAPAGTKIIYLPFDMAIILKRTLSKITPKLFIIMETELWPNLLRVMAEKGVPVLVLNGRISEKSVKGYRKISFFMKRVFSYVRFFGMQSETDADRLKKIGAESCKVAVLGNFKFDMNMPAQIPVWTSAIKGPVIVAGSTHPGEEEILLSAYRENLGKFPDLKLVLAPRHPERFKEVENLLSVYNIPFVKRSSLPSMRPDAGDVEKGVILLDTIGELSAVYGIADIAIVGKSFTGFGGQNPFEPAYWGKPVICGPHMENFPFIREFYAEGAAFEVESNTLAKKIRELLISPEKAKAAGEKAKALYTKNSGAVEKAVRIVQQYVSA